MDRTSWAPADVDIDQPSIARVYDFYLGGSHNFAADRAFAERVMAVLPDMKQVIQHNRAFLRRAVAYMLEQGIDQFIDLGSGIPTVGNVHEVTHAANPDARVAYVDIDPVAVAHSRAILEGNPVARIVPADLRDPRSVLANPDVSTFIDLNRPVGVLLIAVLHFVPDTAEATGIVAALHRLLPSGSYVAISHASKEENEGAEETESLYNQSVAAMAMRTQSEITGLFGDLPLVDPGVIRIPLWHPDSPEDVGPDAAEYPGFCGVGRVG